MGTPSDTETISSDRPRLGVLVSSNLEELAAERAAARTAIESVHLLPVMAEPGLVGAAGADPSRTLIDRSQIFVGIYWQEYGWLAPGATDSAIASEWTLAGDRPRLVYVKEPAPDRAGNLSAMISRIRATEGVTYREFGSSGELAELLVDDLAAVVGLRFRPGPVRRPLPAGTVTMLIVDLADSTPLLERLGAGYVDVLGMYRRIVGSAVTQRGGSVVETEGDGILCAFAVAGPAVSAAVQIDRDMHEAAWRDDERVLPRIGLHTGAVQTAGDSYVGIELHRAFRIAAVANGGQIVASRATRQLAEAPRGDGWRFDDMGSYGLKGLSHTEQIFQVTAPGLPTKFAPLRARAADVVHLPPQLTSLVGRERERTEVAEMLEGGMRLITLTGPGGIGKTRLALAVAERVAGDYPDGVYFVGLDGVDDPDQVVPEVAGSLGIPAGAPGRGMTVLSDFLGARRTLLVLDNFEQVTAAAPRIGELVAHNPGVDVVVTTRIPLRIAGEREYRVSPLEIPDPGGREPGRASAVDLFVERAAAVQHGFELTAENVTTIADICRVLDGLPLAIELAAARIRILSPTALLERLGNRLDVLTGGPTDAPDRHRTLRAAIQWSVEMLSPEERTAFARLGVFSDGADLAAIDRVAATGVGDALALTESLADKSLLRVEQGSDGEPRIRLLGVLADFARAELEASDEAEEIAGRHAEHYLGWMESMAVPLRGTGQNAALDICEVEFGNVTAAVAWFRARGRHDDVVMMSRHGWPFFWLQGHIPETISWLDALGAGQIVDPVNRGWNYCLTAGGVLEMGDYDRAIALSSLAQSEFEQTDDRAGLAWTHLIRAGCLPASQFAAETAAVVGHIEDAIELFKATGDLWGEGYAYNFLGGASAFQGRFEDAVTHLERSLELAMSLEVDILVGQARNWLAIVKLAMGRIDEARDQLRAALALLESRYHLEGLAYTLETTSGIVLGTGNPTQAMTLFGAAEQIRDNIALRPWPMTQVFLAGLGDVAASSPEYTAACATGRQLSPEAAARLAQSLLGHRS